MEKRKPPTADEVRRLTADQRDEYEDRAAIMEYLGRMSRADAEAGAMERVLRKVQNEKS